MYRNLFSGPPILGILWAFLRWVYRRPFFLNYWSLDKMYYYYTPPYTFQEHRPSVCCLGLNKRLGFTLTVPIYTISPQNFSGKNGLIRAGILYKIHFILFYFIQMAERHFFFYLPFAVDPLREIQPTLLLLNEN